MSFIAQKSAGYDDPPLPFLSRSVIVLFRCLTYKPVKRFDVDAEAVLESP